MRSQSKRPIVANKTKDELETFVAEHLAEREKFYLKAQYVWNAEKIDLDELRIDFLSK